MINTQTFSKSNSFTRHIAKVTLEDHKKNFTWTERERILDIGCGPGDVTLSILLPFLPKDTTMVAGDLSENMLKYAYTNNKSDRITYKKINIQENNIADVELGYFNKIFGFLLMHWVKDHRKAFQNMYALLKPSGNIFQVFFLPDLCVFVSIEKVISSQKWQKYKKVEPTWSYEINDPVLYFKAILQDIGFKHINCYKESCSNHFPDFEVMMDLFQSINIHMQYIPSDKHAEFRQDFGDHMKQEKYVVPDEINGGVNMAYDKMVISAQKI